MVLCMRFGFVDVQSLRTDPVSLSILRALFDLISSFLLHFLGHGCYEVYLNLLTQIFVIIIKKTRNCVFTIKSDENELNICVLHSDCEISTSLHNLYNDFGFVGCLFTESTIPLVT